MAQLQESQHKNLGCVVSSCPTASAIGRRVLNEGGNAVDASVAVALALTVTYPQAGNIGGGGLMLVHLASGEQHYLDYRETAPRHVDENLYKTAESRVDGGSAVCVPGTVAGLAEVLGRFGTWAWDRLVSICIPLAESGVWISARQGLAYQAYKEELERYLPTRNVFLTDGRVPETGTLHRIPALAKTFRTLAEWGPGEFYRGRIARQLVREVQRHGGVLDLEDMASYQPRWREPIRADHRGGTLITGSLPSAGGFVIHKSLELMSSSGGLDLEIASPEWYLLLTRVFRVAFWLRRQFAGDPDSSIGNRVDWTSQLLTRTDLEGLEEDLLESSMGIALPPRPKKSKNTTHFCVLDVDGNAVSNTYSLNTLFGSKLAVGMAGFLLNSSIDDFSFAQRRESNFYDLVDGRDNKMMAGHRPVTSMSPTILTNSEGVVELLIGAAGGPRIPTMVATVLLAMADRPLNAAMQLPRIHHQASPAQVLHEPTLPENVVETLRSYGFPTAVQRALGIGASIRWDSKNDQLSACLDPRFGSWN